jgi:hypothetical protein
MRGKLSHPFEGIRFNSCGSTLLMTVITSAVAVLLSAAIVTAVLTTNNVAIENENSQQAYFTARSAVNVIKQIIIDNEESNQNIADNIVNATSSGYEIPGLNNDKMGKATVKVEYWNRSMNKRSATPTGTIKITGTGTYKGVVRSVSAFMQNISMFKYTVYASQNFSTDNVSVNSDSDIFSGNTVSITQPIIAKSVTSFQDVKIEPTTGTSEIGSVHAINGVTIGSGVTVTGDVTSGQVNGINSKGTIQGQQLCSNTDYITKLQNSNTILSSFKIDYKDTVYGDPHFPVSTATEIHTKNISASGVITANSFHSGDKVTIDTSQGDIWLYVGSINGSSSNIVLDNITFNKRGGNKVYFYLTADGVMGNTELTLNNCRIISNNTSNTDIFIFNENNGAHLIIGNSNVLDTCIFISLDSEIKIMGTGSVINGSITAEQINANSGCLLHINNVPPNILDTPLEKVVDTSHDCIVSWAFIGWANK